MAKHNPNRPCPDLVEWGRVKSHSDEEIKALRSNRIAQAKQEADANAAAALHIPNGIYSLKTRSRPMFFIDIETRYETVSYINLYFTVTSGEHKGKDADYSFVFDGDSPYAVFKGKQNIKKLLSLLGHDKYVCGAFDDLNVTASIKGGYFNDFIKVN